MDKLQPKQQSNLSLIRDLPEKTKQHRARAIEKYGDRFENSFAIMALCQKSDTDSLILKQSLLDSYKIGMCLERPTFSVLKTSSTDKEKAMLIKSLHSVIMELVRWFKVDNVLTETEAYELSVIIMDKYRSLSFEDIMVFVNRAKKGDYGKVYNRLDANTILEWIGLYDEQVTELRTMQHQNMKHKTDSGGELLELKKHFSNLYSKDKVVKEQRINLTRHSSEDEKRKEEEFRRVKAEYIKNKGSKDL